MAKDASLCFHPVAVQFRSGMESLREIERFCPLRARSAFAIDTSLVTGTAANAVEFSAAVAVKMMRLYLL